MSFTMLSLLGCWVYDILLQMLRGGYFLSSVYFTCQCWLWSRILIMYKLNTFDVAYNIDGDRSIFGGAVDFLHMTII